MTRTRLRVAAIQMVSLATIEPNLREAAEWIAAAAREGAELVALPEYFCLMGMHDGDKVAAREPDGHGPLQQFLAAQASQHRIWLVGGTIPLVSPADDRVLNTVLVYDPDGRRVARYDKIHLFSFQRGSEVYDEARTIFPGRTPATFTLQRDTLALKVGLSVCYDLRFPELYRAMDAPDLVLVPSAFTATTGRAHWDMLLRARAVENLCYVLAPAQGGRHQNGRRTYGHSMLVDPWGEVLAQRDQGPGVVMGEIDPSRIVECRQSLPALKHRVLE